MKRIALIALLLLAGCPQPSAPTQAVTQAPAQNAKPHKLGVSATAYITAGDMSAATVKGAILRTTGVAVERLIGSWTCTPTGVFTLWASDDYRVESDIVTGLSTGHWDKITPISDAVVSSTGVTASDTDLSVAGVTGSFELKLRPPGKYLYLLYTRSGGGASGCLTVTKLEAEDTSTTSTDKLPLAGGTMTGKAGWALPASDGSAYIQVTPPEASTPAYYERMGGATFSSVFDPVRVMGFNVDAANLPVSASYGTVAVNMEGNFNNSGTRQQEFHLVFGKANGSAQVRAFSFSSEAVSGFTTGELRDDSLLLSDHDGTNFITLRGIATASRQVQLNQDVVVAVGKTMYLAAGGSYLADFNAGDGLNVNALSRPLKLYGGTGILARTAMTIGGNADMAAGDVALTVKQDTGGTAAVLEVIPISAANASFKVTATSDTPTTTYSAHVASTDPSGFIKIKVGSNSRYLPYYN
jgi:hypothetical protein